MASAAWPGNGGQSSPTLHPRLVALVELLTLDDSDEHGVYEIQAAANALVAEIWKE